MLTLNAEGGNRQPTTKSRYERSYGYCQLYEIYHAPFIRKTGRVESKNRKWLYIVDPAKADAGGHTEAFLNYKKQIDYCSNVWDDAIRKGRLATTFYGWDNRHTSNNGFYLK